MIRAFGRYPTQSFENTIYLDLYDKYAFELGFPSFSFNPLIKIRSQETNQEKFFIVTTIDGTYAQRYMKLSWYVSHTGAEIPTVGIISVGNRDFPYGIYDITIWENSSTGNLDPTGAYRTLYMGLMSLNESTNNQSIIWNKYEQEQEQKVYVTNTYL